MSGINSPLTLYLNVNYDALDSHTGSLKINIFKVILWEERRGGH